MSVLLIGFALISNEIPASLSEIIFRNRDIPADTSSEEEDRSSKEDSRGILVLSAFRQCPSPASPEIKMGKMHSIVPGIRIMDMSGLIMDVTKAFPDQLSVEAEADKPAFVDAVAMHQSLVFSIAYHLLHNPVLAEETAQDVFVRLYQDHHKIKSSSHLIHWLRRTTTHRCLDILRQSKRRSLVPLDEMEASLSAAQPDPDPVLARTLRRLVAELPAGARAVMVLRFQEELEPKEIAEVLGLPVNTVKSRLQRALIVLRGKLESLGVSS
jgi:RNA polymerase sigma-70 factor (ECF subfamily)